MQIWSVYKTSSVTDKPIISIISGVHAFPKGISSEVNNIAWLDLELAFYKSAVQHLKNYTTGSPRGKFLISSFTVFQADIYWNMLLVTKILLIFWMQSYSKLFLVNMMIRKYIGLNLVENSRLNWKEIEKYQKKLFYSFESFSQQR